LPQKGRDVEENEKSALHDIQEAVIVVNRVKVFHLSLYFSNLN